ncbi:hypothetical protein VE04_07786, partial [Pseudogymnoascus sp. 24MN13]
MAPRPKNPEPMYWDSLPAELQLMILEIHTRRKNPGWASCAAVCKEWQLFIEKKNFHRLRLRDSCLDEFKHMVIRQRDLVCHIQFIIELPEYSCYSCKTYKPWEPIEESLTNGGITLEVNAYSPSDSEHWFKKYHFISDDEGLEDTTSTQDGDVGETSPERHDPKHGWINGQQVQMPEKSVVQNLFQSIDIGPRVNFPQVDVVTCFMIRRQLRRSLRPRAIHQFTHLLQYVLPKTLKKLSVFEDFNKELTAVADPEWPSDWSPKWDVEHLVSKEQDTVRYMSHYCRERFVRQIFDLNLEELSISYMINAEDFFPASPPRRYWNSPPPPGCWERPQTLALTSQLLQPTIDHPETNALLHRAGISALQMLQLRTMALWNGTRGFAAAFIYQVHRDCASITWRGTWNLEISSEVIEAWQFVASQLHSVELRIERQQIQNKIGPTLSSCGAGVAVVDTEGECSGHDHGVQGSGDLGVPGGVGVHAIAQVAGRETGCGVGDYDWGGGGGEAGRPGGDGGVEGGDAGGG